MIRGDSLAAFAWWCVAGIGAAVGVLTLLTIGPFVLLATFFLCGFLLWRLDFGWGMAGLLTGAGLPVLYAARLDHSRPWSVVLGLALVLAGPVVLVRGRRG